MTKILLFAAMLLQAASFDVASVKPSSEPNGSNSGISTDDSLLRASNVTLTRLIMGAYAVQEGQIIGGPKWINELRYDVTARTASHAGDAEMMQMLQPVLAERFQLAFHRETRTFSGYALTVAKGGIKATVATGNGSSTHGTRGHIEATGCPMWRLAVRLSSQLGGAPVVDQTGLTALYDFKLEWTPEELLAKTSDPSAPPSLFTALQEQLGLKLEARKLPTEVLVIDRAEPPSEN